MRASDRGLGFLYSSPPLCHLNVTDEKLRLKRKEELTGLWPQTQDFVRWLPKWCSHQLTGDWLGLTPPQTPRQDQVSAPGLGEKYTDTCAVSTRDSTLAAPSSTHHACARRLLPPRPFTPSLSAYFPPLPLPETSLVLPDVVVSPRDTWGAATSSQARAGNMAVAGVVSGKVSNGHGKRLAFFCPGGGCLCCLEAGRGGMRGPFCTRNSPRRVWEKRPWRCQLFSRECRLSRGVRRVVPAPRPARPRQRGDVFRPGAGGRSLYYFSLGTGSCPVPFFFRAHFFSSPGLLFCLLRLPLLEAFIFACPCVSLLYSGRRPLERS